MPKKVECRVRPVTRYIVTRFEQDPPDEKGAHPGSSTQHGEFDNERDAAEVAHCMALAARVLWPDADVVVVRQEEPTAG